MIGIYQRDKVANKKVLVAQLCLTLCDSTDYSLPASSVNGIFRSGKYKASAQKKSELGSQVKEKFIRGK